MRREGYELAVSRPAVITKEIKGELQEPYEMLIVDFEEAYQGSVMEKLANRKGELLNLTVDGKGRVRLDYRISTRGLIGFQSDYLATTCGTGLIHHIFDGYGAMVKDALVTRVSGVLISNCAGKSTSYALWNLEERGRMFIGPQIPVYEGMIVGIHSRGNDLVVNVTKEKQLTNIRAAGSDENILLTPPIQLSLEQALEFIEDDELVEITPKSLRLRKKFLKEHERKRGNKEE